ncbi:MAG: helix-hairpin-helix domain-containing protein, partial [Bacteroidales bacterium]|nr:helix-hairpin-helix domain-containing protein [Bacteroidales bacterium]
MFLKDSLRSWLGYTRRERRSSTILLAMIFIIAGIRYVIPGKTIDISELKQIQGITPSSGIISIQDTLKEYIPAIKKTARKSPEHLLDINSSDSAQLEALPGIGPVLSARIIKYRNLLGGFTAVDQLKEVYGLPEETFNLISKRLYADTLKIRKININKARY